RSPETAASTRQRPDTIRGRPASGSPRYAKLGQGLLGVLNPLGGLGAAGRVAEEFPEVFDGVVGLAALEQQKREPVVRARERVVHLERLPVMPDGLLPALRLGERNGHV